MISSIATEANPGAARLNHGLDEMAGAIALRISNRGGVFDHGDDYDEIVEALDEAPASLTSVRIPGSRRDDCDVDEAKLGAIVLS